MTPEEKLAALRSLMRESNVQAYIVPSQDAHQSEYISKEDQRRPFISEFTGSAGTVVVTYEKALLWTDGRYFLQANNELDLAHWTLMKDRLPETIPVEAWLVENLQEGERVAIDPTLVSYNTWRIYERKLQQKKIELVGLEENLVDRVWQSIPKPKPSQNVAVVHSLEFSGQSVGDKFKVLRERLEGAKAAALVLCALDEIAWLLNIRGSDIPFNPVVKSYAVLELQSAHVFLDAVKVTDELRAHLKENGVTLHGYTDIFSFLDKRRSDEWSQKTIWADGQSCSYAIVNRLAGDGANYLKQERAPVAALKAVKNEVELQGTINCHKRDAVALISFLAWLDREVRVNHNETLTESQLQEVLYNFRSKQDLFMELSFETISGTGANGAMIHYSPSPTNSSVVKRNHLYLCDSGSQYKDGTTDITRTVCFDEPTEHQKRCFTRVLQGHIALAKIVFPEGTNGYQLDILARQYVWRDGLDYLHGTGHGVGSYLNVHEGPHMITFRPNMNPLAAGTLVTNEPGYYEEGGFGIRIENVMQVCRASTPFHFADRNFLCMKTISLVPIQTKLMELSLLSREEVEWVNSYHKECRESIMPLLTPDKAHLEREELQHVKDWLERETSPLPIPQA